MATTDVIFRFPVRTSVAMGVNPAPGEEKPSAEDMEAALDAQDFAIEDYLSNTVPSIYIQQASLGSGTIDPAQLATGTPGVGKAPVGNPPAWTDIATQTELDAHLNDTVDAHDASAISYAPSGGIAATTAQGAIDELESEKETWVRSVNTVTSTTYTLVLNDYKAIVTLGATSTTTVTIPPNSSVAIPIGAEVPLIRLGTGAVAVAPGVGVTLNGTPGLKFRAQYSRGLLEKLATDTWVFSGDSAA